MIFDVLCLRPEADFLRAEALPPSSLKVAYREQGDADVPALMKQARALVIPAVGPKLSAGFFKNTSVKFVQVTGAGLDRLDLPALHQRSIEVANVPGGSNSAVAEYVITTASVLLRRFSWADNQIRSGDYTAFRARILADNLAGLDGLLAGVLGLGTVGFAVAQALYKAGCHICYHDPFRRDVKAAHALGAESLSLDELLKRSDIVTLHVPLLPGTQELISFRQLALMKPGAVLIQASRGCVVDETALADALQNGKLGGAAVDVYSTEPPTADNPLLSLQGEPARRLLLTPHIAGVTRQSSTFLFRSAWQNVERVLIKNEPPLNRVAP